MDEQNYLQGIDINLQEDNIVVYLTELLKLGR